ncbi:MAG: hypothetical protein NTZ42_03575 [Candidatus Gribaldobacteria bacterium]|nr:hypothetical protein [Candidatus Gribaldobacteria bacterium]
MLIKETITKKKLIMDMVGKHSFPFFIFDKKQLFLSFNQFADAFFFFFPKENIFYAVKSNPYLPLVKEIVKLGGSLDVSSASEFEMALKCGSKKILFSGPGKTLNDLSLAVSNREKVIVNIDSFGELTRLGELTNRSKTAVKAGVRIFIEEAHGKWNKFGIDLSDLRKFFKVAQKYQYLDLCGIQCHMSWNKNSQPYKKAIKAIGVYLRDNFSKKDLANLKFIDFGGGFLPDNRLCQLEDYSSGIKMAIQKHLAPILKSVEYFTEPGRIINYASMHFLFTIADVKSKKIAIADAGTNAFGVDTGGFEYFPLINLTNPSSKEIPFEIHGSLCTPYDIWGHSCYASKIKEGDIILAPFQGAYTLTLAQNFIKPIPPVYELN